MTITRPDLDTLLSALSDACRERLAEAPEGGAVTLEFQPALRRVSLNLGAREAVLASSAVEPDRVVLFGRPGGARVRSLSLPLTHAEVRQWALDAAEAALRWVQG